MNIISWKHLNEFIQRRIPALIPAAANSAIAFVVGGEGSSLTLRVPSPQSSAPPTSPYTELQILERQADGQPVMELKVIDPALYRTFYALATEIIAQLRISPAGVHDAVLNAINSWASLITRRPLLSENVQVGLIGELATLTSLLTSIGASAFDAWLGPMGEEHDFRIGNRELEVKSTTRKERLHRINGLGQLVASPGMELFILSLQFERAGAATNGDTLAGWVEKVRTLLQGMPDLRAIFDAHLLGLGYARDAANLYVARYRLRTQPMIIPVNHEFPKITRSQIDEFTSSYRIHEVEYDINLEGMGWPEGTTEYFSILNAGSIGNIG